MKRILIVDDEPLITQVFTLFLGTLGMQLDMIVTNNSAEGLEIASKEKFDVAILDYNMPMVSGLEIARKLREVSPETKIMMVSARDFELQHAREEGLIDELVGKPPTLEKFLGSVKPLLGVGEHAHAA